VVVIAKSKLIFSRLTRVSTRILLVSDECIDSMFQHFTCIVNDMKANIAILPYDDHGRALKLLHSLDHTLWSAKVEAIMEFNSYETVC
jgi:hypothetical protein